MLLGIMLPWICKDSTKNDEQRLNSRKHLGKHLGNLLVMRNDTCVCVCTCAYVHTHVNICTYMHTCMHACAYTYTYTYTYIYIYMYKQIHICVHVHIHMSTSCRHAYHEEACRSRRNPLCQGTVFWTSILF